jgi:hypothetical protein
MGVPDISVTGGSGPCMLLDLVRRGKLLPRRERRAGAPDGLDIDVTERRVAEERLRERSAARSRQRGARLVHLLGLRTIAGAAPRHQRYAHILLEDHAALSTASAAASSDVICDNA